MNKYRRFFIKTFSSSILLSGIFFSGERSNFLKSVLLTFIFISFVPNEKLLIKKIKFFFIIILTLFTVYFLNEKFNIQRCSTHPHQVHLEILSEHGLIGYILIAYIFIKFIFSKLGYMIKNKLIFEYGLSFLLLIFFTPLIPSGSLFSSYSGSFFWLILSILNYRLIFLNKLKK